MKESEVSIGLSNPKSPENVGSVMRAAGNYRVSSVFYTGQRYLRALKQNPDTADTGRRVGQNIPLNGVSSLIDEAPRNVKIICIEFAENAISLPEFQHPDNAFYIFGPEDGTLSQKMIDASDAVVYIPTVGCMNLAATVNVVLYDRLAKMSAGDVSLEVNDNELIRKSRDRNNNLKVKI